MEPIRPVDAPATSVETFRRAFPDELSCEVYTQFHRYNVSGICPHCASVVTWTRLRNRKSYVCNKCRRFFSPLAKTAFDHTRLGIRIIFFALLLYSQSSQGISVNFVRRHLGISHKAAWKLLDRIRTHTALQLPINRLGHTGPVWIDEVLTRIGPDDQPICVLGMTDAVSCQLQIIADRSWRSLGPPILEYVAPQAVLITDGWPAYRRLGRLGFEHRVVNHSRGMWVNRSGDDMNRIEGIWANLRRLLRGSRAQISVSNYWKILAELQFRYSTSLQPDEAFWRLIANFPRADENSVNRVMARFDRRLKVEPKDKASSIHAGKGLPVQKFPIG